MFYIPQSDEARADFSALLALDELSPDRVLGKTPGSFALRSLGGHEYIYYKFYDLTGGQLQIYLGPATEELNELANLHRTSAWVSEDLVLRTRKLIAEGCAALVPKHARIIGRLAECGFFQSGWVLVGSQVFLGYQNLFGVKWALGDGPRRRLSDFSHPGMNISLALPSWAQPETNSAIDALKQGFAPVQYITPYLKQPPAELPLELVSARRRQEDASVLMDDHHFPLKPMKFIDYLLEDPIDLWLLSNRGPICVRAPQPQRYAVHKLLVHVDRPGSEVAKANKDLDQAACLIQVLQAQGGTSLQQAWAEVLRRGVEWSQNAQLGLAALQRRHPALNLAQFS